MQSAPCDNNYVTDGSVGLVFTFDLHTFNLSNKIIKGVEYFIDKLRSHQDNFRNSLLLHNFDFSSVV